MLAEAPEKEGEECEVDPEEPGPQSKISLLDQHSTLKKKAEEVKETAKDMQVKS